MTIDAPATADEVDAGRQCSRCREVFPIEPDTHPMELIGWWTCPPCTEALIPGQHRAS